MAGNVVVKRRYIEQTYRASPQRDALQAWVDGHPQAVTRDAIAAGLKSVMSTWTQEQLSRFSLHVTGQAFDVRPVQGPAGDAIKATIRALPNLHQFLEREAGRIIWHAAFVKR